MKCQNYLVKCSEMQLCGAYYHKGGVKCRSLSLRAVICKTEISRIKLNEGTIQSTLLPVKQSRNEVKNLLTEIPMQLKIKSSLLTT